MGKRCPKCGETDLNQFRKDKGRSDGYECYCQKCIKASSHEYYLKNKEIIRARNKKWAVENREKYLAQATRYNERTKEKYKENRKQAYYRYVKTERGSTNNKMSCRIRASIKDNKRGRHWESLVGYTLDDLMKRLQKTLPLGYTMQDFYDGRLHIDHIIPITAFNFSDFEQIDFKRCWALSNLRLLPAKENLKKNNKLFKPFQPALQMVI